MEIDVEKYNLEKERDDFKKDESTKNKIIARNAFITFQIRKSTNQKCAVKITRGELTNENTYRSFTREVKTLIRFQHPAIVPFLGFLKYNNHGYIYLTRFEKGSLYSLMRNSIFRDPKFDFTHKFIIAYGTARAMNCLHSEKWVHRDLKSENILLDEELRPFLTDFGTSKKINEKEKINQTTKFTSYIIMAPEFMDKPLLYSNSLPIDVYSYGITLFELLTEIKPYSEFTDRFYQLKKYVTGGGRPAIPESLPQIWKDLIVKCWSDKPSARPTFDEIISQLESDKFLSEKYSTEEINRKLFEEYKTYLNSNSKESSFNEDDKDKSNETPPTEIKNGTLVLNKMRDEIKSDNNISTLFTYTKALFEGTYDQPRHDEETLDLCRKYIKEAKSEKELESNIALISYYAGVIYAEFEDYENAELKLFNSIYHGNVNAAFYLAELKTDENTYLISNKSKRNNYIKMAAEGGNISAIKKYANMLYNGELTTYDKKKALEFIQRGSDDGEPELMYMWAIRNEYGIDIDQNTDNAMYLLECAMHKNYTPAIINYAFHLYNGVLVSEKNRDSATEFFNLAAEIGDPEGILWSYVISCKYNKNDEYKDLFMSIIRDGKEVPEAWSVYGAQLFDYDSEYQDTAVCYLNMAIKHGSISALIKLAEICEKVPSFGNGDFYYEQAAHHCHLLDEIGFFTPTEFNVFHCDDCNLDMCQGCAKFCHKGHSTHFVKRESAFKCNCGKNGLNGHCSGEFVGEQKCYQHLYLCSTCCTKSDCKYICKCCAENCHKEHQIVDCGIKKDFCSCGMKKLNKCTILDFSNKETQLDSHESLEQRCFQCADCQICGSHKIAICEKCAQYCHKECNNIIDLGVKNFCCCCKTNKDQQCNIHLKS